MNSRPAPIQKPWADMTAEERSAVIATFKAEMDAGGSPPDCPKCGTGRHWLLIGYKSGNLKFRAVCRPCNRRALAMEREQAGGAARRNRRWESGNRKKALAHRRVENAITRGQMSAKPCQRCGRLDAQAHHDDYDRPLDVTWLCPEHHAERHRELDGIQAPRMEAAE